MRNRLLIATFLSLFLFGGGLGMVCGQSFISNQMERLARQTGISLPKTNGTHYHAGQYNGLPITVIVSNGEVIHIGLSLFTPTQRQFLEEAQCNFIERIALAGELPDFYGIGFRQYLTDEKVEVLEGRFNDLKTFITDTTYIFQSTLVNGKTYIACWYTPSGQERYLTLTYPANFHLIAGIGMIEAEDRLYNDIRQTKVDKTEQYAPVEALMQRIGNGPVYLLKGDIYFLPELNSNRYYVKDDSGHFSLLYSEDFPLETFANLTTGIELKNQYVIETKLVKYGYNVDQFTMPLQNWLAFCIQSGCTPYFGVISQKENEIIGELIMQNEALGYTHVMKLSLDPSTLKGRKGVIKARLNSYVPMSNVKALFNESK